MSAKPPRRRNILIPGVIILSFFILGGGIAAATANGNLTGSTPQDQAKAQADYTPPTGLDVRAPVPKGGEVGGAGAIEPADRPVSLAPEVSGVVSEVLVNEGDKVAAGQPLVRLRDASALAELAGAQADTRTATSDLTAARADAAAARARADLSRATAARTATLLARDAATADEQDRAQRTLDADEATARASAARIEQAAGRLKAAQAREELAHARVDQLTIRAPSPGEVLQVLVRAGESASPGAAVVVVGDTSRLRARIDVNERDALSLKVGQPARVRVEGSTADLTGKVVEIARRVGRKNVRTEDPTDRQDARFVETVLLLDEAPALPMGIRVDGYVRVE